MKLAKRFFVFEIIVNCSLLVDGIGREFDLKQLLYTKLITGHAFFMLCFAKKNLFAVCMNCLSNRFLYNVNRRPASIQCQMHWMVYYIYVFDAPYIMAYILHVRYQRFRAISFAAAQLFIIVNGIQVSHSMNFCYFRAYIPNATIQRHAFKHKFLR